VHQPAGAAPPWYSSWALEVLANAPKYLAIILPSHPGRRIRHWRAVAHRVIDMCLHREAVACRDHPAA
ncbi:MAG: hypothetical protein L0Y54_19705, partial [Sporichthyaceae bacterium]|nr:hypothetical protein [Sporichthyaceae bacterium]